MERGTERQSERERERASERESEMDTKQNLSFDVPNPAKKKRELGPSLG